jgi:16S rRNA C967 or C1407 C5-methylase (RsmB/RsmF family)
MKLKECAQIPLHIRASFPKPLFDRLSWIYGEERAFDLCLASNTAAPVTIRANLLKTTRDTLMERLRDLPLQKCRFSEVGIVVKKRMQLTQLPEFREGLFEYQDEASQLCAERVQARPGQQVLDYCAGSGGKALAIAARMENRGQIFLHDVRKRAAVEAKVRLRRAGVQNGQILIAEDARLSSLKGKMDWVLVDAPCTGSGTWRRNPDMKWRFESSMIEELVAKQRKIFEEALNYLAPKGQIVYVTCSLFPEENGEQVSYFMEKHGLRVVGEPFQSLPQVGQMDGFFSVTLAFR